MNYNKYFVKIQEVLTFSIGKSFCKVRLFDFFGFVEVGDSSSYFDSFKIATSRKIQLFGGTSQKVFCFFIEVDLL